MTGFLILIALIVIIVAGVPIAFALGGLGLVLLLANDVSLIMVPQGLYSAVDNFILLAAPLFILMSNILLKGGVGRDLFAAVQAWVGHWPGGIAVATVISCAIFAAISGSSVATAATVGVVAIPEMIKRGYKPHFVYGLLAAGGTLGILIPPSIPMIVLGVVRGAGWDCPPAPAWRSRWAARSLSRCSCCFLPAFSISVPTICQTPSSRSRMTHQLRMAAPL